MTWKHSISLLLMLGGCPGFGSQVADDTPTYIEDVAPILEANCVRCHGDPLQSGAPMPLDTYEHVTAEILNGPRGDNTHYPEQIVVRAVDEEEMPLGAPPLSEADQETLVLWVEQGVVEE